jgi:hypothetical protein
MPVGINCALERALAYAMRSDARWSPWTTVASDLAERFGRHDAERNPDLVDDARRLRHREIVLETTSAWQDAAAFYRAIGFGVAGSAGMDTFFVLGLKAHPVPDPDPDPD